MFTSKLFEWLTESIIFGHETKISIHLQTRRFRCLQNVAGVYLLQFVTGHGQMSWVADCLRREHGWQIFLLSMLSINRGILLDSVEMVEAGEEVDSKKRRQNVRLVVSA